MEQLVCDAPRASEVFLSLCYTTTEEGIKTYSAQEFSSQKMDPSSYVPALVLHCDLTVISARRTPGARLQFVIIDHAFH